MKGHRSVRKSHYSERVIREGKGTVVQIKTHKTRATLSNMKHGANWHCKRKTTLKSMRRN